MKKYLGLLEESSAELKEIYGCEFTAYESWLKKVKKYEEIDGEKFKESDLNKIFKKPVPPTSESDEINESGDIIEKTEEYFKPNGHFRVFEAKRGDWIDKKKRQELFEDKIYKNFIFKKIGGMPTKVKNEIREHSLQILSRCNNPEKWEETNKSPIYLQPEVKTNWKVEESENWFENKTGLVYGMVQSGKTASMISLMGLANASGYNLFILLCGGKNSLRDQTQERVNEAFGLDHWGGSNDKIISLTNINDDYNESVKADNGTDAFRRALGKTIIICVKKEINQLKKLIQHLNELKKSISPKGQKQFKNFKALIIDDEADYASQNTLKSGKTAINKALGDIRSVLSRNSYVAYTATPQACIVANHTNLIGYPNSFIWLLDPYRDKYGKPTTYLGLKEFFDETFSNDLVQIIDDESWPHWKKDDPENKGIYSSSGSIKKEKLTEAEKKFLKACNETKEEKKSFIIAIIDFIISGTFKWLDHMKEHNLNDSWIDINKINQQLPNDHPDYEKNFPFHAMMFNLSYINENQELLSKLLEIQLEHVKKDFVKFKVGDSDTYFTRVLEKQKKKSERFGKPSKNYTKDEVLELMKVFIDLMTKNIPGKSEYIYILNSKDEGDDLNYNEHSHDRTKKAAIILGGHILSRGLTINGLSTSFFVRSQSMSLGDTNLQMCRWFGHKKPNIQYQSLYIQKHSQNLFKSIADIDYKLRYNFSLFIMENVPAKCMLLSLRSSQFFRATSPTKSRGTTKGVMSSYSGKSVHCTDMFNHNDFMKNESILKNYIERFKSHNIENKWQQNRANVFYNVYYGLVVNLFKELHFDDDCLNVSPKNFLFFMNEWEDLPKINIAFYGYDRKWDFKGDVRRRDGTTGSKTKEEAKERALDKISNLISSQKRKGDTPDGTAKETIYLGDAYIDRDREWIIQHANSRTAEKKRKKGDSILIIFWILDGNYLCKHGTGVNEKRFYLGGKLKDLNPKDVIVENENQYLKKPLVSFSVIVPPGGPYYKIETNEAKKNEVLMNPECVEILDELPLL